MELPAWLAPADVLPTREHGFGPLIIRTLALNQLIALPVALAMASVGGRFLASYAIASTYSQCIGLLCAGASMVTFPWMEELSTGKKLSAMMAHYFVGGVVGAEAARRLSVVAFPWVASAPVLISWAVGATIAVLVGAVILTVSHLRARVVSTELEALQARINPHFLFNTLNSIAALIREDPARAEAVTLQLSALFRYTLQAPRQGLVSLDDEMTIVRGYLGIEQERLAHRLTCEINVDVALLPVRVPALILQPLVENAIKHGVAMSVNGGSVGVRGWRESGRVVLAVTNTGSGRTTAPGTGEGIDSIRRRLRATFGASASVTLTAAGDVTEARVSFPHEVARP